MSNSSTALVPAKKVSKTIEILRKEKFRLHQNTPNSSNYFGVVSKHLDWATTIPMPVNVVFPKLKLDRRKGYFQSTPPPPIANVMRQERLQRKSFIEIVYHNNDKRKCYRNYFSIPFFFCFFSFLSNFCRAKVFRHGCSPVNLLHIFRTPFYKNTYGGLLL